MLIIVTKLWLCDFDCDKLVVGKKHMADSRKDVIVLLKEYRSALITNAVTSKIDVRGVK